MNKREFIETTKSDLSESMPQLSKQQIRRIKQVLDVLKKKDFKVKGIPTIVLDMLNNNEFQFFLDGKNAAQFSDQAFGKQPISLETLISYIDENSKAIDKELDKDKDEI